MNMETLARTPTTQRATRWPLERVLFAMAGTVILISTLLVATVSAWFLILTAFVGINLWAYVLVRACPASLILRRLGVTPACTW